MNKVIVADDHIIFRYGLVRLLTKNGFEVIAEADNAIELREQIALNPQADIVVSDCRMPGSGPLANLSYIQEKFPDLKVLFITGIESLLLFQQLLSAGANGVVVKSGEVMDIIDALKQIASGGEYLPENYKKKISKANQFLTAKEFEVLELILQGFSNPKIAKSLHNSESTINTHRVSIMRKTGCSTVVELVHFSRDNGLYVSEE